MKRGWILTIVAVVILVLAGGYVMRDRRAANAAAAVTPGAPAGTSSGTTAGPAVVSLEFGPREVITLKPTDIARTIPLTGSLRPTNQTVVRSRTAGEIRELLVREGSVVKAGQVIARIDPVEFEWRVKEREAQVRQADAQLQQARRTLDNNGQLLAKNFISQSAYDTAKFSYDAAVGARDAAVAQLTMARKSLTEATVLSPMNGIVVERFAQAGEKVSPDNRIVSLVDLSKMEIEAPVPASEIGAIEIGQPVTLTIEGIETPQVGQVVRISPSTQAGTRSVPVYIGLDNRDPKVRAGLFAQGQLAIDGHRGVIVVPEAAIRDAAGRLFVYVIVDGKLTERDITTGLRDPSARAANGGSGIVEVTRGLAADEQIVAVNLGPLRVGSAVRVSSVAVAN